MLATMTTRGVSSRPVALRQEERRRSQKRHGRVRARPFTLGRSSSVADCCGAICTTAGVLAEKEAAGSVDGAAVAAGVALGALSSRPMSPAGFARAPSQVPGSPLLSRFPLGVSCAAVLCAPSYRDAPPQHLAAAGVALPAARRRDATALTVTTPHSSRRRRDGRRRDAATPRCAPAPLAVPTHPPSRRARTFAAATPRRSPVRRSTHRDIAATLAAAMP